jgi:hypothetical protein
VNVRAPPTPRSATRLGTAIIATTINVIASIIR